MTNDDIYKLVNFITRKESKGTPETINNFTRLLQKANLNHFDEEYQVYQANQNINDSISPFEVRQLVSELTIATTTITLPTDYAHFIGMYWTDINNLDRAFDLVTDDEWDMRCGSTLTVPSDNYPICKLVNNKLYIKPNLGIFNDWFSPSKDELNKMHINLYLEGVGDFADGIFYWSSSESTSTTAWSQVFDVGGFKAATPKSSERRVRACRKFLAGSGVYSLRDISPSGGLIFYIDGTTYYEAAPSDQGASQVWSNIDSTLIGTTGTAIGTGTQNTLDIIGQAGHTSSAAKLCNDLTIE